MQLLGLLAVLALSALEGLSERVVCPHQIRTQSSLQAANERLTVELAEREDYIEQQTEKLEELQRLLAGRPGRSQDGAPPVVPSPSGTSRGSEARKPRPLSKQVSWGSDCSLLPEPSASVPALAVIPRLGLQRLDIAGMRSGSEAGEGWLLQQELPMLSPVPSHASCEAEENSQKSGEVEGGEETEGPMRASQQVFSCKV